MRTSAVIASGSVFEDTTFVLLGRILGLDGAAIQQIDVSAIAYQIFDLHVSATVADTTGTLVIADTIFDTLQTDAQWDVDSTGYNFRWQVLSNALTAPGHTYRIEVKFTAGTNEDFWAIWTLNTLSVYSS